MFGFLLLITLCVPFISAQDSEVAEPKDKTECIKKFVQWCNDKEYPQKGTGMSLMSLAYHDKSGFNRVLCASDSDGTNCTRNGSPWFTCTPDHTLTYKGEVLSDTSDADEDICQTVDMALNELSVQKFSHDNATLTSIEKELRSFFEEMAAMQEQMQALQRKMMGEMPFLNGDFWGGFGDPFPKDTGTTEPSDNGEGVAKDTNKIEKE